MPQFTSSTRTWTCRESGVCRVSRAQPGRPGTDSRLGSVFLVETDALSGLSAPPD